MPSVVLRPRAFVDLAGIWAFIAEDSVKHADRFAALIDSQFRALARQPQMGRVGQSWQPTFTASH
jgi:toxin ParE1/3/4